MKSLCFEQFNAVKLCSLAIKRDKWNGIRPARGRSDHQIGKAKSTLSVLEHVRANIVRCLDLKFTRRQQAEVLAHAITGADVTITLLEAPVRPIAVNDAFDIFAGCEKRFETCQAKFANAINFCGFPYIPG